MRCFLAIPLSDEIKDYLFSLTNDLKKEFKKHKIKANFVPKKNLHITLMFLGDITDEKLSQIKSTLSKLKFKSFRFNLNCLGVFPNENLSRVLWAGIKPEKEVVALQKKIDLLLLDTLGLARDHEFGAHITLARTKHSPEVISIIKNIKLKPIEQNVESFVLFRSELHKDGAKYFLLERFEA